MCAALAGSRCLTPIRSSIRPAAGRVLTKPCPKPLIQSLIYHILWFETKLFARGAAVIWGIFFLTGRRQPAIGIALILWHWILRKNNKINPLKNSLLRKKSNFYSFNSLKNKNIRRYIKRPFNCRLFVLKGSMNMTIKNKLKINHKQDICKAMNRKLYVKKQSRKSSIIYFSYFLHTVPARGT